MDTVREGGGGQSEREALKYRITMCKMIASGELLYNKGAHLELCDDLERWHGTWEGGSRGRRYMHTDG